MRRPCPVVTRSLANVTTRQVAPRASPALATRWPTDEFTRHHNVAAPQLDGTAFRPGWIMRNRRNSTRPSSGGAGRKR